MRAIRLTTRRFIPLLAVAVSVAAAVYFLRPRAPERVILIIVDMLRADHVSCYGGTVPTPRMDRLAFEGIRVPHAVASFHQTTMSLAAIFTGQTPSMESTDFAKPIVWTGKTGCGMARFATAEDGECVPQRLDTLAETLKQKGFWTIGIASSPLTFDPAGYSQGFDDWRQLAAKRRFANARTIARERGGDATNDAAIKAVDARRSDRFFLYVHYMDVHDYGFHPRSYADSVKLVDDAIGRLLDQLDSRGLLRNTVIVLTSDHGERLGEEHALPGAPGHVGNPSFETLLRVPLIIWPKRHLDLPPVVRGQDTRFLIERIAGIESPRSTELDADEVLLTETYFLTYRRYPYKAIWRRSDNQMFLFDLGNDPGERRDIAGISPDLTARHRERMGQLAKTLVSAEPPGSVLTESDKERLRALGYLD